MYKEEGGEYNEIMQKVIQYNKQRAYLCSMYGVTVEKSKQLIAEAQHIKI